MALFLWKPSYEVGVPEIDDDHRQLVELINALSDAMKDGRGYLHLEQTMDGLLDYVANHFETEESFMRITGYPLLADHERAHRSFKTEFLAMAHSRLAGNSPSANELLVFLCNWMRDHVTTTDKELGIHLRKLRG